MSEISAVQINLHKCGMQKIAPLVHLDFVVRNERKLSILSLILGPLDLMVMDL